MISSDGFLRCFLQKSNKKILDSFDVVTLKEMLRFVEIHFLRDDGGDGGHNGEGAIEDEMTGQSEVFGDEEGDCGGNGLE